MPLESPVIELDTPPPEEGEVKSLREWERVGEAVDSVVAGKRKFLPQGNPAKGWGRNFGDRSLFLPRPWWFVRGLAFCQLLAEKAPGFAGDRAQRTAIRNQAMDLLRERREVEADHDQRYADAWLASVLLGNYYRDDPVSRSIFGALWRRIDRLGRE